MANTFPQNYMGIHQLIDQNTIFKRKFRWTFDLRPRCTGTNVGVWFVRVAARPNISIEETELNFLNSKTWIPGKASFETITVTYLDVAAKRAESADLYGYLNNVFEFTKPARRMGSTLNDYAAEAFLRLYDGCGQPIETWSFRDMWPTTINFGDLDYSSSDTCDIELTFRYSDFSYESHCGRINDKFCCTGC